MPTTTPPGDGAPQPGPAPHAGPPGHAGRDLLKSLLRERNQSPARVADIDRQIVETFQRRAAVLALDLCGFSRLTQRHGILFYLSMIVQMEEAARPAIVNNNGSIVKQEADNLFAVFRTPADALEAALDIFIAFNAVNSVVPTDRDLYASVGIGYGDLLVIADNGGRVEDVFGMEMNGACRLGEDTATKGEILLTPAAGDALPAGTYLLEPVNRQHHGAPVEGYRFVKRLIEADEPAPQGTPQDTPQGTPQGT